MTSFGMLMNSPDSEFQRISPQERACVPLKGPETIALENLSNSKGGEASPFGPGGAAKPMLDGRKAEPGGWNRFIINVDDLPAEVARLRQAQLHFRNDIAQGPGGSEIILEDPSGNPIELFQPAH